MIFGGIRKVPTECPHCGHTQQEPVGLISTYCRGCGDHYTVAPKAAPAPPPKQKLKELGREKLHLHEPRHIACHECGHEHDVQPHLQNTACPACGSAIQLQDIEITG